MILLHNISDTKHNSNYNSPKEVLDATEPLSFDGVYYNVYLYQYLLEGKDVTLFITGDYIGGNNAFDVGQPLERFCDWNQIMELVQIYNCKLGWHTWSHRDLTQLTDQEVMKELIAPIQVDYFAYPYGKYDDRVIDLVKAAGYKAAYSVTDTDGTEWTIPRQYIL